MSNEVVLAGSAGRISVMTPQELSRIVVRAAESFEGARVRRPRRGLEIEVHALDSSIEELERS